MWKTHDKWLIALHKTVSSVGYAYVCVCVFVHFQFVSFFYSARHWAASIMCDSVSVYMCMCVCACMQSLAAIACCLTWQASLSIGSLLPAMNAYHTTNIHTITSMVFAVLFFAQFGNLFFFFHSFLVQFCFIRCTTIQYGFWWFSSSNDLKISVYKNLIIQYGTFLLDSK